MPVGLRRPVTERGGDAAPGGNSLADGVLGGLPRRLTALGHVGHGRGVPEAEHPGDIRHLEAGVHHQATMLGRQAQHGYQRAGSHPGAPDEGVGRNALAIGEPDAVGAHLRDGRPQPHLDPPLGKDPCRTLAECLAQLGQHPRCQIEENPADVARGQAWVLTHRPPAELHHLSDELGPGVPGSDDHEGAPRPAHRRIVGGVGILELVQHMIA